MRVKFTQKPTLTPKFSSQRRCLAGLDAAQCWWCQLHFLYIHRLTCLM